MLEKNQELLRLIMRRRKLTCPEVAAICGVKANTVRKWRCGLRAVPDEQLAKLKLAAAA